MNQNFKSNPDNNVIRIGLIPGPLGKLNLSALRFLVLRLNTLQRAFVYEFLPCVEELPFIELLSSKNPLDLNEVIEQAPDFLNQYHVFLEKMIEGYEIKEEPPPYYVLLSTARFTNRYYSDRTEGLSIIALGYWERYMAPPSLIEFFITLILRESVAFACHELSHSVHLGTKGCLCDFTVSLDETRFKVLNGFICDYCTKTLKKNGHEYIQKELNRILRENWIGSPDDLSSPASIVAKLGYDLFLTKGITPTVWERLLAILKTDGIKELIKIVGGIIVAGLLLWLGLNR